MDRAAGIQSNPAPSSSSANSVVLPVTVDRYRGVSVAGSALNRFTDAQSFAEALDASIDVWMRDQRRGAWLQIPIHRSFLIQTAVDRGFEFHHAQKHYVQLTQWLPHRLRAAEAKKTVNKMDEMAAPLDGITTNNPQSPVDSQAANKPTAIQNPAPVSSSTSSSSSSSSFSTSKPSPPSRPLSPSILGPSLIPAYASHSLGVGCVVLNSRGETLAIQEKYPHPVLPDFWKLPGGAVDVGEDLSVAAEREVMEETGIRVRFHSLLGFRHLLNFRFGTGDLYFIAVCFPLDQDESGHCPDPVAQPSEISAVRWWDVQEFFSFHSTRWMSSILKEVVLEEWKKIYPNKQLPPPPSAERLKELSTMPPHPEASKGKFYPLVEMPTPPPPGSTVGMSFTKIASTIGNVKSNFYVCVPTKDDTQRSNNTQSSSSSSTAPNNGSNSSKL